MSTATRERTLAPPRQDREQSAPAAPAAPTVASAPRDGLPSNPFADSGRRPRSGWFGNRKVRTKILSAIGVMALVAIVSTVVAFDALESSGASLDELTATQNDVMAPLSLIHQNELKARGLIAMATIDPTPDGVAASKADIAATDAETDEAIAKVDAALTASDPEHWNAFKDAWSGFKKVRDEVLFPLAAAGDRAGYQDAYAAQAQSVISSMADNLDAIEAGAAANFETEAASADSARNTSMVVIFLVLGLGLAAAVALGLYIASAVTRPLQRVKRALDSMSRHDLTVACDVTSRTRPAGPARSPRTSPVSRRRLPPPRRR